MIKKKRCLFLHTLCCQNDLAEFELSRCINSGNDVILATIPSANLGEKTPESGQFSAWLMSHNSLG